MEKTGSKYLKAAGILEVIMGIATIALALFLLSKDTGFRIFSVKVGEEALWSLILLYAFAGFCILAGILGIVNANSRKHSGLLMIMGIVLIIIQVFHVVTGDLSVASVVVDVILMAVPAYYFYGAYLNSVANYVEKQKK